MKAGSSLSSGIIACTCYSYKHLFDCDVTLPGMSGNLQIEYVTTNSDGQHPLSWCIQSYHERLAFATGSGRYLFDEPHNSKCGTQNRE